MGVCVRRHRMRLLVVFSQELRFTSAMLHRMRHVQEATPMAELAWLSKGLGHRHINRLALCRHNQTR